MNVIAGVSALALMGALIWSAANRTPDSSSLFVRAASHPSLGAESAIDMAMASSSATSTTPLGDAILGQFATRFIALAQNGLATSTAADTAADIVPSIQTPQFNDSDIPKDSDTSLARVIQYRNDLRIALAPLLNNTTPELDIYAQWIDTGDDTYLKKIASIAGDYDAAVLAAQKVRTPADAVHYQVGILNAMAQFSMSLKALSANAKDPIASVTLLRTYNMAEQQMFTAFNALGIYAAQKATPNTP